MQQVSVSKPSDFPRDKKFRDPMTPPFCDENGVYHVFSMADVMQVLVNREAAFTRDPSPWLPDEGPLHMALNFMWMIEPFTLDGAEGRHDPLRRVVEPWFKNRAVRTMQPIIRELTFEMINEVVSKGTGELNLATELSSRLSMRVICRLTGIELEREHWMRKKLDEFNQATWSDLPPQWEVQAYFWQMVAKRTARPQDELLDVIVEAWKTGAIDDDELLGYIYGFMAAGTDTTGASLVNAFALLAEFDLLDYTRGVLDDDEAMRRLVEEILRFGTPFPMKPLYVRKDSRFGELDVPAGSVLTIWFSAANRDEAVNGGEPGADPNVFDPKRWPNKHIALGWAKHHCLGAELARLETRILIEEALRRLPGLRMDESKPFSRYAGLVDSVTEAYFTFDQEHAEQIRHAGHEAVQLA
ncbi:MAG: cytochrome P450 [Actinomycetia bacterium]|nr:cytochrome P450 [Actinomycetes bacterium]